jgi:uncharacterized protein HemX
MELRTARVPAMKASLHLHHLPYTPHTLSAMDRPTRRQQLALPLVYHQEDPRVGAKAGIAVGCAIVDLLILGAVAFLFLRRRREHQFAVAQANEAEMKVATGKGTDMK